MAKKWEKVEVRMNGGYWYLSVSLLDSDKPYAIRYSHINQAYGKPSIYKVSAFNDLELLSKSLLQFINKISGDFGGYVESGVCTRNSCMFTYASNIYDSSGNLVIRVYATHTRTELEINPYYHQFFNADNWNF